MEPLELDARKRAIPIKKREQNWKLLGLNLKGATDSDALKKEQWRDRHGDVFVLADRLVREIYKGENFQEQRACAELVIADMGHKKELKGTTKERLQQVIVQMTTKKPYIELKDRSTKLENGAWRDRPFIQLFGSQYNVTVGYGNHPNNSLYWTCLPIGQPREYP